MGTPRRGYQLATHGEATQRREGPREHLVTRPERLDPCAGRSGPAWGAPASSIPAEPQPALVASRGPAAVLSTGGRTRSRAAVSPPPTAREPLGSAYGSVSPGDIPVGRDVLGGGLAAGRAQRAVDREQRLTLSRLWGQSLGQRPWEP